MRGGRKKGKRGESEGVDRESREHSDTMKAGEKRVVVVHRCRKTEESEGVGREERVRVVLVRGESTVTQ